MGFRYWPTLVVCAVLATSAVASEPRRPDTGLPADACGVYAWPAWRPEIVNRRTCPLAKGAAIICPWSALEPRAGEFQFDAQITAKLKAAAENDYYVSLAIWSSPNDATPRWLYEVGVPPVYFRERITPFREKKHDCFPYYFDKRYVTYYHRLLEKVGEHLASLPAELRNRIVFVESCEGATGDPAPYYGLKTAQHWPEPLDVQYRISYAQWSAYRIETWKKYREVFQNERLHYPLLFKSGDINEEEFGWLLAHLPEIGSKQALFCEYYQISASKERLQRIGERMKSVREAGKGWFTRGEYDAQWKVCGWSTRHPEQALYWTAIDASNAGLDIWQVHYEALQLGLAKKAVGFFNRYAGQRDPATAPAAFCALRVGLDAADTTRFPEGTYGKASRANTDRYLKIAEAFRPFGAYQGDPEKAKGGVMQNRQADDYNDVGWDVLPGNYGRFLEQIDADATSIGWWHQGPQASIYGRFARGLDVAAGKRAMFFRLAERFCAADRPNRLLLRVVYLDEGRGTWALRYDAGAEMKEALRITNSDSGNWLEASVVVGDASMRRGGPRGSDLVLTSCGGDSVFHLVEVEKQN